MRRLSPTLTLVLLLGFCLALIGLYELNTRMNDLTRNMTLKAFDPHRADFVCQHEAEHVPPIDAQAEQWLQQGLAATSGDFQPELRDYKKAALLWQQAGDKQHWKAMLNLASLYAEGQGVTRDSERAVQIVEAAMKLGIPGAFDLMGTYHMDGLGVNQDASRAYAFWELAADMGSPSAQAYLGSKMDAVYDNPKAGFWGNRKVALKMLECGFSQGNARAAFELGTTITGTRPELGEDNARALFVLHEGVKFGSEDCASALSARFNAGAPMVKHIVDEARGQRYSVLATAMRYNRDLRYPNLDKVLPLPPARLPKWNGDEAALVNAAKGVVPAPVVKPTPGAKLSGRAHIPDGWALPANPVPPPMESVGRPFATIPAQYETTAVRFTGYWLAQLLDAQTERHAAWDSAQAPQRYAKGESFAPQRQGLGPNDGRVMWHYLGVPAKQAAVAESPQVTQGIARSIRIPEPYQRCQGNAACTHTGVWHGQIDPAHPQAKTYNRWDQQAYVEQGAAFPKPEDRHLAIAPADVRWLWLGQANAQTSPHYATISLDEAQGSTPARHDQA